jgi:hypothetical protein
MRLSIEIWRAVIVSISPFTTATCAHVKVAEEEKLQYKAWNKISSPCNTQKEE